jgi:hypothetical protein
MPVDPAHKGKQFPPFSLTVERGKVREFAKAIEDPNPAYLSDGPELPPTFPTVFAFWGEADLTKNLSSIGVEIWQVLHAEQEFEYLASIKVGDTVTGQPAITDIYTKEGRSGAMDFIEVETIYTNQDGVQVLKDRALLIVRQ